jgi:putative ABC transport system substrate-binding protein
LELLKEALPGVSRVAVLRTPAPNTATVQATEAAARALGLHLQIFAVQRLQDLEATIAAAKTARAEALNVHAAGLFFANRTRVVEAVAKTRLPAIYEDRAFVDVGGLLSYGPDLREVFRQAAVYVDKILKGARAAELPIEQPTKFELIINLKAAKALGLTIPQSLLLRADGVID